MNLLTNAITAAANSNDSNRRVNRDWGGRLLVENDPDGGAIFRLHQRTDCWALAPPR